MTSRVDNGLSFIWTSIMGYDAGVLLESMRGICM